MAKNKIDWPDKLLAITKIFQSEQLKTSIDNLAQSMKNLHYELSSLNSMMITQNEQVKESIRHAKENVEELRKEFEKLNQEMGKSNVFFERMYKSSEVVENLTFVLLMFTVLIFTVGLYPIVKDNLRESNNIAFSITILISIGTMLLYFLIVWIYKKYVHKK